MFERKELHAFENNEVLANDNNISYLTGNATLDRSKLEAGQVIRKGTAIFKNDETGLFELVQDGETPTPETMRLPVLTAEAKRVEGDGNVYISAWTSAEVHEDLCRGITTEFKRANPNFIYY